MKSLKLLILACIAILVVASRSRAEDYFPPAESQGGWRVADAADAARRDGGMDPAKLADLRQWLLKSDDRDFAAVVIRHGYLTLQVERGNSARDDARRVASVSKAVTRGWRGMRWRVSAKDHRVQKGDAIALSRPCVFMVTAPPGS